MSKGCKSFEDMFNTALNAAKLIKEATGVDHDSYGRIIKYTP